METGLNIGSNPNRKPRPLRMTRTLKSRRTALKLPFSAADRLRAFNAIERLGPFKKNLEDAANFYVATFDQD